MKALKRMALILTPLLAAQTGRFAAGVARLPAPRNPLNPRNLRIPLPPRNGAAHRSQD
jgi:hypothetical protein